MLFERRDIEQRIMKRTLNAAFEDPKFERTSNVIFEEWKLKCFHFGFFGLWI